MDVRWLTVVLRTARLGPGKDPRDGLFFQGLAPLLPPASRHLELLVGQDPIPDEPEGEKRVRNLHEPHPKRVKMIKRRSLDEWENHEKGGGSDAESEFGSGVLLGGGQVRDGEPLDVPDLVPRSGYEFRVVRHARDEIKSGQLIVDGRF